MGLIATIFAERDKILEFASMLRGGKARQGAKMLYAMVDKLQDTGVKAAITDDVMAVAQHLDPKGKALREYLSIRDAVRQLALR